MKLWKWALGATLVGTAIYAGNKVYQKEYGKQLREGAPESVVKAVDKLKDVKLPSFGDLLGGGSDSDADAEESSWGSSTPAAEEEPASGTSWGYAETEPGGEERETLADKAKKFLSGS